MNKIHNAFENKKAFIGFVTGGDPDLETTEKLVVAMEEAGADLIEIGIPFSDPIAEGVVIQEVSRQKLDELSQQVRYMGKYGIETFDDLYAEREKLQRDMDALITRRTKLQNKIRRATPAEKETLRQEKAGVTEQITTLRKQLKLNKAIEVRSAKIQEKTDLLYANEYRAKEAQQQKKSQRRERDPR